MKKKSQEELKEQMVENQLFKDYFGPSNNDFLSFQELGIKREDIVWIDH